MKTIDVKDQFRLSVLRTFNLTVSGIRYRLFRASVTVVVVAVAIAFLMNVLSEGLIVGAVGKTTRLTIRAERLAERWVDRLSVPATPEEILLEIAGAESGSPAYAEGMKMGGLVPDAMRMYHKGAKRAAFYIDYFHSLGYAHRRLLVYTAEGIAIFDRLRGEEEYKQFERELRELKSLMFPTDPAEFKAFLDEWPIIVKRTERIRKGRSEAQARFKAGIGSRDLIEGLAEADGEFGRTVREAGFELDEGAAATVALQARRILDKRRLKETVLVPDMRRAVAAKLNKMPAEINELHLWGLLRGRGNAEWYYRKLEEKGVDQKVKERKIDVARAMELARREARLEALTKAELRSVHAGGGFMGIGERMTWLVVVAMLVCVVGVANAMLMSVTERFREIATLKCLGALDGSIMLMFVMEAGLLGVIGGVIGALAGSIIGLVRMLATFGLLLFSALPTGQVLVAVLLSTGSGVVLSAIAAVYPSFRAARLAPMEAMRIQ